jgi:DNA-binding MarR family transcriptional regulator/GNAT superfamily N-acetyltransferase
MEAQTSVVRRFNRLVTQRVGALHDSYLARERSLGEARLLWEIGPAGREIRSLRHELELDSGYVSRLLRSLETAGLVSVGPQDSDRRVRVARLTEAGRDEWELLDRRSDELARSILAPLDDAQRARLVGAMSDVERLLTAAEVEVGPVDPSHPRARHCVSEYVAELDRRFEGGFVADLSLPADDADLRPPGGVLLVATRRGEPVGCVAVKTGDRSAQVKRMWVDASVRGLGVGRRLLSEAESFARSRSARVLRLETHHSLVEAIALYRSAGYVEVEPFNDERYADHWFEKTVPDGR